MLLDGGNGSSSPGQGKGPLKPAAKPKGSLDEWMRKPSTPADQVKHESATPRPSDVHFDTPAWQARWDDMNAPKTDAPPPTWGAGMSRGGPRGDLLAEQMSEENDAARAKRAEVLGITTGALSTTPEMVKEMTDRLTPAEYDALSEKQRAAVDFNTSLALAVRRDLRMQDKYKPGKDARKNYDEAVDSMFGKENGSDIFAPETMAVLRQLKINDKADDLDDYLGLKVAITEDDLKSFDQGPGLPGAAVIDGRVPEADRSRIEYKQHLVDDATTAMQSALDKGAKLMQDYRSTMATARRTDIEDMGGSYKSPEAKAGFGASDLDRNISGTFDELLGYDKQKVAASLQAMQAGLPQDQLKAFFNYADTRTRETQQRGIDLSSTGKTSYSPEEFRKMLGLKD